LKYGEHGLPLMGGGDWNDGMDQVGEHGKGESIWLAFFLYRILKDFSDLAVRHNDKAFADLCESEAQRLHDNIEKHGWDGNWYLRAYFDDGSPLGSAHNDECQIDSIAQSWSVLSGVGSQERTAMALESAYNKLVDKQPADIIRLLYPPFDKTNMEPGYIKGYIPGVRENGGQYTHAATWLIMAFAKMGNANRVWELLSKIIPVNHTLTQSAAATYKGEPYVIAGDVLAPPNTVQAGWTWYTGSAGWMYRLMTETVLGIRLKDGKLHIEPCVPDVWTSFKVVYRYGSSVYNISFTKHLESGELNFAIDGQMHEAGPISLTDDGGQHEILVNMYQGNSKVISIK
jgi:cellobiose phosphorylase